MIIHGAAGAGKSATVKDFLEAEKNQKEKITLMFSASDLDVKKKICFSMMEITACRIYSDYTKMKNTDYASSIPQKNTALQNIRKYSETFSSSFWLADGKY